MPTTPLGIEYPVSSDPVRLSHYYERLAVTADAAIAKAAASDLQRCYFRIALGNNVTWGVDGPGPLGFDVENVDPAGVASVGAGGGFTAPRNGRVDFRWSVGMVLTSGSTSTLNATSWLTGPAGELRRGSQRVDAAAQGTTAGYVSHGSALMEVAAGAKYFITAYLSAPGAGKRIDGLQTLSWFEGMYVQS